MWRFFVDEGDEAERARQLHMPEPTREFEQRGAFGPSFPVQHDAIREHPPEDKPYGMRDFLFVEPNGYIVIVGQPIEGE